MKSNKNTEKLENGPNALHWGLVESLTPARREIRTIKSLVGRNALICTELDQLTEQITKKEGDPLQIIAQYSDILFNLLQSTIPPESIESRE